MNCFPCDGTGLICNCCGESELGCECEDEQDLQECPYCGGEGVLRDEDVISND